MLGIPIGFLTANFTEWAFHKYILHGLGIKKDSMWNFHWHGHHKTVRKNNMIDPDYFRSIPELIVAEEGLAIILGGAALLPLLTTFPWFVTTVWVCGVAYYAIHRQAHIDPDWAKRWVPHHWDHHMLGNQQHNWNVTVPLMDYLLGTRVKSSV